MLNWSIEQLHLDLKYTWKISRNASTYKINSLITVSNGRWKGMGEGAPNIRYGETPEGMIEAFNRFVASGAEHIQDIDELTVVLNELKLPNALRFAIESAYIHFLCHAEQTDTYQFLGIQHPQAVPTSFSLPIMDPGELQGFYDANHLARFQRLKVKVNKESATDLITVISQITKQPLIIDGNEAWTDPDEVIRFMQEIQQARVALIEQPMPAGSDDAYTYLKPRSPHLLFADESICDHADFDKIKSQFHGINMKLMKAGGYLNGLHLLNEAVKHQLHTMVGCMVETTLGISSALSLCAGVEFCDLDGFLIISNEPFGIIKEQNGLLSIA